MRVGGIGLNGVHVLVVGEAAMCDDRDIAELLTHTAQTGTKDGGIGNRNNGTRPASAAASPPSTTLLGPSPSTRTSGRRTWSSAGHWSCGATTTAYRPVHLRRKWHRACPRGQGRRPHRKAHRLGRQARRAQRRPHCRAAATHAGRYQRNRGGSEPRRPCPPEGEWR
ncbi:hypothetical protein ACFCZ1_16935 [Streptomyces sp. NPDC056224]|uniref:hypothetical protein n=1 Tax=Streptomyces sp. NPDC056224 TaxID=3345750 RepID=UPI0035DDE73E